MTFPLLPPALRPSFPQLEEKLGTCDFHLHTQLSDGVDSLEVLLQHVLDHRLGAFALTDHDTILGNASLIRLLKERRAQDPSAALPYFVPGVEMSLKEGDEIVHVLAYFPDGQTAPLVPFLRRIQSWRMARNRLICEHLQKLGMAITMEEVYEGPPDPELIRGRVTMARLLCDKGYLTSVDEAFDKVSALAHPPMTQDLPQASEGVAAIRQAGGLPILAHPYKYSLDKLHLSSLDRLVQKLVDQGLMGIEAGYWAYTPSQQKALHQLARQFGLVVSAGSDYHGAIRRNAMYTQGYIWYQAD